jgi:4-aminobutyrate aminotransferase
MAKPENVIQNLSPVWYRYTDIVAERGEGCYIYDQAGTPYLDFTSGIGVTNTGHCHPRVVEAVRKQAGKLLHGQVNINLHPPLLKLIEELRQISPPELDGFFFSNSGAEAVEGAVKLARMATGRTNVIVFQGSFHGRTVGTMSGWTPEETTRWCLDELRFLLLTQTAPEETAAILIEPVLGEGGYVIPPRGFLKGVREICDEYGIMLIVDEIQSGFGRTGKWFAYENFDSSPDVIIMAKGLASGLPLSGVVASMEAMNKWIPGSHGGTYGGNALACAAAVATIEVIREEELLDNAQERGTQLISGLRHLQERFPQIGDVRGLGLMIGVELIGSEGKPDKQSAKDVTLACLEEKLLLLTCGPWDNTVRFIPPLVVTEEQVQGGLEIFEHALEKALGD